MSRVTFRTARYARAWIVGPTNFAEEELRLDREGTTIPATLVRPLQTSERLPAWVVLHGITRQGRAHEQLARFTRAIISTGAVAIVPEVPEWREMALAPHLVVPTLKAAIAGLRSSEWAREAPVGVIGFSFSAPHVIAATAHPDLREDIAGSVAFGGYCDLARTIRFLMTGMHEWKGRHHHLIPDAYGRWIVAANYMTAVPEYEDATDVADALRTLARHAGDVSIPALDPRLDPRKAELRASVAEERRPLFDLFAPVSARLPDAERGPEAAEALAAAAHKVDAESEPARALAAVERPVHVLHGRRDHLIPFSEGLRLQKALPAGTWSRATITRLFGHSKQDSFPSLLRALKELPMFFGALRRLLQLV